MTKAMVQMSPERLWNDGIIQSCALNGIKMRTDLCCAGSNSQTTTATTTTTTTDPAILSHYIPLLTKHLKRENIITNGNFEFLGIPLGDEDYVYSIIDERMTTIDIKLLHITKYI